MFSSIPRVAVVSLFVVPGLSMASGTDPKLATTVASESETTSTRSDPCSEPRYLELKLKPLDEVTEREYEYFMQAERLCAEARRRDQNEPDAGPEEIREPTDPLDVAFWIGVEAGFSGYDMADINDDIDEVNLEISPFSMDNIKSGSAVGVVGGLEIERRFRLGLKVERMDAATEVENDGDRLAMEIPATAIHAVIDLMPIRTQRGSLGLGFALGRVWTDEGGGAADWEDWEGTGLSGSAPFIVSA